MSKVVLITFLLIALFFFTRYNKKQRQHLREKRKDILKRMREQERTRE